MKKFYTMLTLLVAFATTALGQVADLKQKAISYDATVNEKSLEDGAWYMLIQKRGGDGFAFNSNGTFYKKAVASSPANGTLATKAAAYLFKATKVSENVFNFQCGDGKYLGGAYHNTPVKTSNNPVNYRLEPLVGDQEGHWGLTHNGTPLDNNGNNGTLAGWNGTPTYNGNNDWRFIRVTLTAPQAHAGPGGTFALDKRAWKVTALNETPAHMENGVNGPVANVADEDNGTFYHSDWSGSQPGKGMPQAFQVDLGQELSLKAFGYIPRTDANTGGRLRKYDLYISSEPFDLSSPDMLPATGADGGAVATGVFDTSDNTEKTASLDQSVKGRYVLLVARECNDDWFTCSEFYLYTEEEPVTVTYNFVYQGIERATQSYMLQVGAPYPNPEVPFGVKPVMAPEGSVERSTAIDFDCEMEENLPFVPFFSNDLKDWYALRLRDGAFAYYDYVKIAHTTGADLGEMDDTKFFQLVGDPFNGFRLYNMAMGNTAAMGSTNLNTGTRISTIDKERIYILEQNDGKFNLREKDSETAYLNKNGGMLSYWNDANAKGEVGSTIEFLPAEALYTAAIAKAQRYAEGHKGHAGTVGSPSKAKYDALVKAIPAQTPATLNEMSKAVKAANAAVNDLDLVLPSGSYAFRIAYYPTNSEQKNTWYMMDQTDTEGVNALSIEEGNYPDEMFWTLTKEGNAYTLRNKVTGRYLPIPVQGTQAIAGGAPAQFTFQLTDKAGVVTFGGSGQYEAVHADAQAKVVGWTREAGASQWTIIPESTLTALQAAQLKAENVQIYDLSGRRVQQAKTGLYIINGKKRLVK